MGHFDPCRATTVTGPTRYPESWSLVGQLRLRSQVRLQRAEYLQSSPQRRYWKAPPPILHRDKKPREIPGRIEVAPPERIGERRQPRKTQQDTPETLPTAYAVSNLSHQPWKGMEQGPTGVCRRSLPRLVRLRGTFVSGRLASLTLAPRLLKRDRSKIGLSYFRPQPCFDRVILKVNAA